ncbi:Na/Pi cotransporter family protein [Candidatus Dojkabacteria bacterium]|uniref:Na/Pi cotransporter family protein n=1 Tax=Candidatus Dojkabacteria bacterium TaxID=2099670 RepID=A0A847EUU7_9BACT|nr:Na/Pi cotransporter family protein [Candidatus Dojkabacteria bacterium]
MDIFKTEYLQIALAFISALILFLYAIDALSKEIQDLASNKFREILGKLAKNKYLGTLFGALLTALLQSSTAVGVMTILLVNTGVISFHNSLGILFGSNIGTTVTAQLVLLDSTILAPLLMIVGLLLGAIGKKTKIISKPIFHIGFLLLSLTLISSAIEPLKSNPEVMQLFSNLSNPLVAFSVSALFTALIHSSSVTTGIIVILAQNGLIPIEVAIPMVLGANVGTNLTALIAAVRLNLFAKRVAVADFMFDAIGTFIFMFLIKPFSWSMQYLSSDPGVQTALAHLIFNVIATLIFLTFSKPFEKLVITLVKGNEEEILFKTKYLKGDEKGKPRKRINCIKLEITYSIENTIKLYQKAISLFYNPSNTTQMEISKFETLNDYLDDEITKAILQLTQVKLSPRDAHATVTLIKISNTIEQLGDLGNDLSQVFLRMHKLGMSNKEINIEKLTDIHNRLIDLFRDIEKNIITSDERKLALIKVKEEEITALINEQFDIHVLRLQKDAKYDGTIFVDAISIIESSVYKVRSIRKLILKQIRDYGS